MNVAVKICLSGIQFQSAKLLCQVVLGNTILNAHLFQSDDELVDFNDVVVYPGSTMLFKVLHMTSGCS